MAIALLTLVGSACQCGVDPPPPADSCDRDIDCPAGERCGEAGLCESFEGCAGDADCAPHESCRIVDGTCRLRPGFGTDCSADPDCYPGFFCALGRCRDSAEAWVCSSAFDCPAGFRCDRSHFYCIEEVPCGLAEAFPEITCDPGQVCDPVTQACLFSGPLECTPENQALTCGPDELCDASGRCVQCTVDAHCGPGLRCNSRAGRCESEDLCRRDSDCTPPLICDPEVALCRVPLPPCDSDQDCAISEFCNRVTGSCEPLAGSCTDDRLEENDSPVGAQQIDPGEGGALIDALQICPDDDDYFAVPLLLGQGLTAVVSDVVSTAQAEIELFAPDGATRLRQAFALPRGNGTVSATASEDGLHYVRVLSRAAPTPYDLRIEVAPRPPCEADGLEGEGRNDSPNTAVPLAAGSQSDLSLCLGDVDHYRVELGAGEALRVTVRGEGELDPDLRLLDGLGSEVLARAAGAGRSEQLFFRAVSGGARIVEVSAYRGAPAAYALELELLPAYSCEADELEGAVGNDSAATASSPAAGLVDRGLSLCQDDEDWFEVALEDFERLVAVAHFEAGDVDLDLEAYLDPAGALLASSRAGAGVEALSVPAGGAPGTVWLRVFAADGAVAPYQLSLYTENAEICLPDPDEPNEIAADAGAAPAAGQFSLCGFDEDLYAVELEAGKRLDASILFSPYEGDLDLQLLHPDGVTPLATSDGVGEREHLQVDAELDGTHYLRVYALSSEPRARYFLSVSVTSD